MFVVRLLAAGALVYAGFRLRKYLSNDTIPTQHQTEDTEDTQPVEDVLMEDPVCRRLVPKKQALILHHIGATHYFCSEHCRRLFQQQREERA